jgi:hypothetical protein
MHDLVERLNPYRNGTADQRRSGRLVVLLSLIVAVAGASYAAFYTVVGIWLASAGALMAVVGPIAGLAAFQRHERFDIAGHGLAGSGVVALMGVSWATGGIDSVALAWFLVVPMVAAMLGGRRAGLVWIAADALWIGTLFTVDAIGIDVPNQMPTSIVTVFAAIVPVGLIMCAYAIVWSYENAREEAMARIEAASTSLQRAHASARAVLDHVGQGLVIVAGDGSLQRARSAAFDRMFTEAREGAKIWDLLATKDPHVAESVEVGWLQLADGWLPRDVALDQLPTRIVGGRQVLQLAWDPAGGGDEVMLVVTDITAEVIAEAERAAQGELVALFTRSSRDRRVVVDFFDDASRTVEAIAAKQGTPEQDRRWIHTLKGNSAIMGLERFAGWLHALETAIAERNGTCTDDEREALRVQWAELMGRAGMLLGTHDAETIRVHGAELESAVEMVVTGQPRPRVAARMKAWTWDRVEGRLEQLADQARRLADRFGKSVELVVEHNDVRTPPTETWSAFWGAMVHVVRNAVDHGIESDRDAKGKPMRGTVKLCVEAPRGLVRVCIEDDGGGVDWDALSERARALGLPFDTDAERVAALLSDGVTSRREVTDISGRGIGAAALRQAVEALHGTIAIESVRGEFTRFTITLPLGADAPAWAA